MEEWIIPGIVGLGLLFLGKYWERRSGLSNERKGIRKEGLGIRARIQKQPFRQKTNLDLKVLRDFFLSNPELLGLDPEKAFFDKWLQSTDVIEVRELRMGWSDARINELNDDLDGLSF